MSNWYYYNENKEKIAVTGKELKQLALQGTVTPETFVETHDGRTGLAKNVTGLTFPDTAIPDVAMLAEAEKARKLMEEHIRLQQEALEFEKQKLALEQEKIKLEREQLAMQQGGQQSHSPQTALASFFSPKTSGSPELPPSRSASSTGGNFSELMAIKSEPNNLKKWRMLRAYEMKHNVVVSDLQRRDLGLQAFGGAKGY